MMQEVPESKIKPSLKVKDTPTTNGNIFRYLKRFGKETVNLKLPGVDCKRNNLNRYIPENR